MVATFEAYATSKKEARSSHSRIASRVVLKKVSRGASLTAGLLLGRLPPLEWLPPLGWEPSLAPNELPPECATKESTSHGAHATHKTLFPQHKPRAEEEASAVRARNLAVEGVPRSFPYPHEINVTICFWASGICGVAKCIARRGRQINVTIFFWG